MTPEQRAAKHEQRRQWTQRRREQGIHTVPHLLPQDEYVRLFTSQLGRCAICRQSESARDAKGRVRRLSVDHDHVTDAARGLLCSRCNSGLGLFLDDPELLRAALAYLTAHIVPELRRDAAERLSGMLR